VGNERPKPSRGIKCEEQMSPLYGGGDVVTWGLLEKGRELPFQDVITETGASLGGGPPRVTTSRG